MGDVVAADGPGCGGGGGGGAQWFLGLAEHADPGAEVGGVVQASLGVVLGDLEPLAQQGLQGLGAHVDGVGFAVQAGQDAVPDDRAAPVGDFQLA